uniref:Saposin B-type domain-containing protein n=1 Tax=Sus scrofa TaxID=9823 RepID=A0A8D1LT07_PIG
VSPNRVLILTLCANALSSPGLAFSGLTPEDSALARAHPCDGEQFCQNLAPEDTQGDQLLQREELGYFCESCRKIIQKLEDMVGPQPNEDTVTQAASQVCDKLKILRGLCKKIMRSFLRRISWDILTGKKPQAICVDIKICKEETGECRGDIPGQPSSAHVTRFNNTKYTCQRELHKQQPEKWDVLSTFVCLAHIMSFPPTLNMGKWGAAG